MNYNLRGMQIKLSDQSEQIDDLSERLAATLGQIKMVYCFLNLRIYDQFFNLISILRLFRCFITKNYIFVKISSFIAFGGFNGNGSKLYQNL